MLICATVTSLTVIKIFAKKQQEYLHFDLFEMFFLTLGSVHTLMAIHA